MLNFIYYPVSAILWFWHQVFGFALGPRSGFAWALAIIFLECTVRPLLVWPFIGQVRSQRKLGQFEPQIKAVREKYRNDKHKLNEEMQKLQKEHGLNPLGGCLGMLVQLPVFVGMFHVMRGFQPEFRSNYVFDHADIVAFADADLFGVKLSDSIAGVGAVSFMRFALHPSTILRAVSQFTFHPAAIPVAAPLLILIAIATHDTFCVVQLYKRAEGRAPLGPFKRKLAIWKPTALALITGIVLPVGVLIYIFALISWTLCQQVLVYNKLAREAKQGREHARQQPGLSQGGSPDKTLPG